MYSSFSKIQQYQYYTKPWYRNIILYLFYSPSLLHGDFETIPHSPSAFIAEIEPASFLKWSNIGFLGGKCHCWVELGGRRGGGGGGAIMGTLHGDFETIPHSPSAFIAEIHPDSFLK